MRPILPMVVVLAAFAGGCGKPDAGKPDAGKTSQSAPAAVFSWPGDDLARIDAKFGRTIETASGLRYQPIAHGTGTAKPRAGDLVSAHYRGTLLDDTVFDDSYKRGQPIRFQAGVGRVIKGWDEALLDMRLGEKRRLIIPYWLAYGAAGRPGVIPPKATLVFEVELVEFDEATTQ